MRLLAAFIDHIIRNGFHCFERWACAQPIRSGNPIWKAQDVKKGDAAGFGDIAVDGVMYGRTVKSAISRKRNIRNNIKRGFDHFIQEINRLVRAVGKALATAFGCRGDYWA